MEQEYLSKTMAEVSNHSQIERDITSATSALQEQTQPKDKVKYVSASTRRYCNQTKVMNEQVEPKHFQVDNCDGSQRKFTSPPPLGLSSITSPPNLIRSTCGLITPKVGAPRSPSGAAVNTSCTNPLMRTSNDAADLESAITSSEAPELRQVVQLEHMGTDLHALREGDLRKACQDLNLPTDGGKAALIDRLVLHTRYLNSLPNAAELLDISLQSIFVASASNSQTKQSCNNLIKEHSSTPDLLGMRAAHNDKEAGQKQDATQDYIQNLHRLKK